MANTRINYFSVADIDLQQLAGNESHVLDNADLSIIINGRPADSTFLREGEIYQIPEPRLLLVMNGDADIQLDLEHYHIHRGTLILTTPDMILEFGRCSPDAALCGIAVKDGVQPAESIVTETTANDFEQLLRMMHLLWDIASQQPYRHDTVQQLLAAMLSNVRYIKQAADDARRADAPTRSQQLFLMFKKLVSQHCERERNIPFYASLLHVSPHHLSAIVSKASGQSVMYWINRAVALRAKLLLQTTDLLTYEIAERLHFANPPAFNNFFKRETGMTPRTYRNHKSGTL